MAAHIVCHNNDILPNTFPPPRPSMREHGYLSQYGASIVMHDTFPSMPSQPTPASNIDFNLSDIYDPALSLTPEKKRTREPLNRGSDEGMNLKPQNSTQVRFDNFVEIQELSPKVSNTTNVVHVERDTADVARDLASGVDSLDLEREQESELEDPIADIPRTIEVDFTPDIEIQTIRPKHNTKGIDRTTHAYILNQQPEHMLARPEFNSTLRVSKEVQQLEDEEIDVAAAVVEKLKQSAILKTTISDKATSKLNSASVQFDNLVSVDITPEQLNLVGERQKPRVKPAIRTNKLESSVVSAPDILEYLTPELQTQSASLSVDGLPPHTNTPSTARLDRAFDVYRHIRSWQK